jgi:hypothetical protein
MTRKMRVRGCAPANPLSWKWRRVEPIGVESWLCADDDLLYVCGGVRSLQRPGLAAATTRAPARRGARRRRAAGGAAACARAGHSNAINLRIPPEPRALQFREF